MYVHCCVIYTETEAPVSVLTKLVMLYYQQQTKAMLPTVNVHSVWSYHATGQDTKEAHGTMRICSMAQEVSDKY
jgi:hypothetical protein